MSALANREFVKMNGLGNEIVIVDLRRAPGPISRSRRRASPRGTSLTTSSWRSIRRAGAPTLRFGSTTATARRRAPAATACAAWRRSIAAETGKAALNFETEAGLVSCWRAGEGLFTVDMGAPRFRWDEIPLARETPDTRAIDLTFEAPGAPILHSPSGVSMGNPHAIFWVDDPQAYDLRQIGPQLEHHRLFPQRANITLAKIAARDRVAIRTWERGAGLTKACGSAACAAAVAAARLDRAGRKVTVSLPGGDLAIEWREADDHVLMTGPVEYEHKGRFDAALFAGAGVA